MSSPNPWQQEFVNPRHVLCHCHSLAAGHICAAFWLDTCDLGSWLPVSVKDLRLPQVKQAYLSGCHQQCQGTGTKLHLGSLEPELECMPLQ